VVFNFHPHRSHLDYRIAAPPGKYRLVLTSDDPDCGGHGRLVDDQSLLTLYQDADPRHYVSLYLPARTVLVLEKVD
jgi:1,4-alpha-glucan branching enzyme